MMDIYSEKVPSGYECFHINVKALKRFLNLFPEVQNCVLTWRCDSNSALGALKNEGSTKSWPLYVLSCDILRMSQARGISWDPIRISSQENLIADAASR